MNYMEKVAEMLGVEMEEEFKVRTTWSDSSYDLALYKLGKLYRTREEAEAQAEEDKAYWDEVRKEIEE